MQTIKSAWGYQIDLPIEIIQEIRRLFEFGNSVEELSNWSGLKKATIEAILQNG